MEYLKKIGNFLSSKTITSTLFNLIGICAVLYLGMLTQPIWGSVIEKTWLVAKPFVIAFTFAFVLEPLIIWFDRRFHNRTISVTITYILLLGMIIIVIGTMVPLLYNGVIETIPALTDGLNEIQVFIYEHFNFDISSLTSYIYATINDFFKTATVLNTTIDVLNQTLANITNFLIYYILGIYISSQFLKVRKIFKYIAKKIDPHSIVYLRKISQSLIEYEKAFLIGALAQGITCGIMYLVIGNKSWVLLGILAAVSSIFPYIGPIVANFIGIITSLGLGFTPLVILLILIFVQSTIMSYVITPKIYSSQTDLSILWVLFGILTGSTLLGIWGMLIAMPILVSAKTAFQVYTKQMKKKQDKLT